MIDQQKFRGCAGWRSFETLRKYRAVEAGRPGFVVAFRQMYKRA
jgi:hypothetical protein